MEGICSKVPASQRLDRDGCLKARLSKTTSLVLKANEHSVRQIDVKMEEERGKKMIEEKKKEAEEAAKAKRKEAKKRKASR